MEPKKFVKIVERSNNMAINTIISTVTAFRPGVERIGAPEHPMCIDLNCVFTIFTCILGHVFYVKS